MRDIFGKKSLSITQKTSRNLHSRLEKSSFYVTFVFTMDKRTLKKLLNRIYDILLSVYGPQVCYLTHSSPFELIVATILSAQCTDKKVNSVTPGLFAKYPTPAAMAKADLTELEEAIHACGFYHAKARNLIGMAGKIAEDFHGEVPDRMEDLVTLPGVGRKTANVVLGNSFGIPGLPVDTHVTRISNLLGIVKTGDATAIEKVLCSGLPPERWTEFSHLLIIHGRTRCPARRPDCANCEIRELCRNGKKMTGAK